MGPGHTRLKGHGGSGQEAAGRAAGTCASRRRRSASPRTRRWTSATASSRRRRRCGPSARRSGPTILSARTLCCGPYTKRERDERAAMSMNSTRDDGPGARARERAAAARQKTRVGRLHARQEPAGGARRVSIPTAGRAPGQVSVEGGDGARRGLPRGARQEHVPEEQARQEALNRQRERLLAKRADDRHRARGGPSRRPRRPRRPSARPSWRRSFVPRPRRRLPSVFMSSTDAAARAS